MFSNQTRLEYVLSEIKRILGDLVINIKVITHTIIGDREHLKVRVELIRGFCEIREFIKSGKVISYGYYFQYCGHEIWWNNKPFSQETETFPHHAHEDRWILPLHRPYL